MMKNQGFNAATATATTIGSNNSNEGNNSNARHNMMWTSQERLMVSNTGPGLDTDSVIVGNRRSNNIQLREVPSGGVVPSSSAMTRVVKSNSGGSSSVTLSNSKTDDIGSEFDMMLGIELDSSLRESTNGSSGNSNNNNNGGGDAVGMMEYGSESGVRMDSTADTVAGIPVLQQSNRATYGFEMNPAPVTQDKRMLGTPAASDEMHYHYSDTPTMRSNSNHHPRDVGNGGDLNNFILHGQLNSFLSDMPPPESTVPYSQMLYPQHRGRSVSNVTSSGANRHSNNSNNNGSSNRNNSNSNRLNDATLTGISQVPQSAVSGVINELRYSDQNTQSTRGQSLPNGTQNTSGSQKVGSSVGSRVRTPKKKRFAAKDRINYGLNSRSSSEIKVSNKNGMVLDLDDQRKQFSKQANTKGDSELASGDNNFNLRDSTQSPQLVAPGVSTTAANTQISGITPAAGPAGQGAEAYASTNRQQLYQMTMNNNPHLINDPSIQENLSPYFTPFGIDVSHLPMTNPPIFQCSVPVYDVPVRKRRISISNGQISQLGEDIETVDDLYNTQPPPMPRISHTNNNNNNDNNGNTGGIQLKSQPARPVYSQEHKHAQYKQHQGNVPAYSQPQLVSQQPNQFPQLRRDLTHISSQNYDELDTPPMNLKAEEDEPNINISHDVSSNSSNVPLQQQQQQQQQFVAQDITTTGSQTSIQNEISGDQLYQYQLQQEQKQQQDQPQIQQPYGIRPSVQTPHLQTIYANTPVLPLSMLPTSINDPLIQSNDELTPGTKAWKKARLLERNRIAASKCRQRKKMAQLQLQKDFDKMSKENVILRKKVIYYEKLISKFKKFAESHFKTRSWSNSSSGGRGSVKVEGGDDGGELERDGKNALKVIQEMLMIDEGISEVDESGKVTKMYLDSNDYIGGGDLNVDVDADINTGIGTVGR